jgi:ATP/ADP translocase/HEAT repeat protein
MTFKPRIAALQALRGHRDFTKLAAMMALYFVVVFVVGILRPVRAALALDGLAAGDFYQVYFVSAVVMLFAPAYNHLADRMRWKYLIPSVAVFFALSLLVARLLYEPGSGTFGMVFYGWYDLLVAALVTQFFIATQIFFNTRDAKRTYPLVIAAGSVGAAVGGGITAFFSQRVGTPNLLLVAAGAIVVFAGGLLLLWWREDPDEGRTREVSEDKELSAGELRRIFSNRQVQLIAATVLLTILVKQIIDYEYATITKEVFVDLDRVSGFLGLVDAATQWLPIVVLVALRPILRRWGMGVAVLIFPVAILFATGGLAVAFGLWAAVGARQGERMFRYSAERTSREILYVPVPDEIKLKAKAYIDVAVEKGLGKVFSGVLIFLLLLVMGYREVTWVGLALAFLLLAGFLRVRSEYVRTLAKSIEGRFASLRGTYVSITGGATIELIREAMTDADPLKVAFALDLVDPADPEDLAVLSAEMHTLLTHESPQIRARVLGLLTRIPAVVDHGAVRARLQDDDQRVREAAVKTLAETSRESREGLIRELLDEKDARVRAAALVCLAHDLPPERAEAIVRPFYERRRAEATAQPSEDHAEKRLELAVAAGLMRTEPGVEDLLRTLIADSDPAVASAALESAGQLASRELVPVLIQALGSAHTRPAARSALEAQGGAVLEALTGELNDQKADPHVRRNIPSVLAAIPTQETVDALIHSYQLPETDQVLDNRTLKALNKLRVRGPDLDFDQNRVTVALEREIDAAEKYLVALAVTERLDTELDSVRLLARALREARSERRESIFRWLGLVYPSRDMYRSYLAVTGGDERVRANGIEWLETTIGHALYQRIRPALRRAARVEPPAGGPEPVLRALWEDEDVWLARCALWAMADAGPVSTPTELARFAPGDPGLQRVARRIQARLATDGDRAATHREESMDLIEKVFLLQNVDLLRGARSAQLALLGSIAQVVDADGGKLLIRRGEPTDALYIVIRGEVELQGVGEQTLRVIDGSPFGTWALIDEDPSLVEARTVRPTRLLRIQRRDFYDLLSDHPELGLDLLQGLARRVRTLVRT